MYKKKNYYNDKEKKENKNDKEKKENNNDKETKKTDNKNHNRIDNKNNYNRYNKSRYENKTEFTLKDYMIKQHKITLQEIENEKKYKPPTEWIESLKVINIKILL